MTSFYQQQVGVALFQDNTLAVVLDVQTNQVLKLPTHCILLRTTWNFFHANVHAEISGTTLQLFLMTSEDVASVENNSVASIENGIASGRSVTLEEVKGQVTIDNTCSYQADKSNYCHTVISSNENVSGAVKLILQYI